MTDESDHNGTSHDHGNPAGDRDGAEGASGAIRLTAPDDARPPRLPFPVVGIGASAGGLEAFSEFLDAMPPDSGMAFVFIQHLPPDRPSMLADILQRHTRMPVAEVEDGQQVEADTVYVIRPGHTLTIGDGKLHLGPVLEARGHGRPVDDFFRSLAEEQQQRAVAVVLSGMGSNGTAGAEAVKTVGGVCIAQDPTTAKFGSMPRNLIDNNLADFVLRTAELPDVLRRYANLPYTRAEIPAREVAQPEAEALADILALLRTRTKYDFAGYRKPTVLRRVQRRMGLADTAEMGEYARRLRQNVGEVTALADDLLIHVTGFFRDPDAWEALRERVVEPLVTERPAGSVIRAWVTACATGEEAYTLAMLLLEAAEAHCKQFDIKLFATDMAERALGHARAGLFPGGIESEITPERLHRFFDKDGESYRVKRAVRELVVFAPQNVLHDPPFSRLDIVTCRNLLIYLEPETQKRVLALLHFSLREGGTLMLGSSETAGAEADAFAPIDKLHRLYRRVGPTRHGVMDFPLPKPVMPAGPPPDPAAPPTRAVLAQVVTQLLLNRHTPAAVAVDGAGRITYFHGDTGRYLDQPRGEPTRDLFTLVNDQARAAVRSALDQASGEQRAAAVWGGQIDTPTGRKRVLVGAVPLGLLVGPRQYLVTFTEHHASRPPAAHVPTASEERAADEAERTRDELQTALEQLQTANEELRASNEEMMSMNEELQSANEELETSKEEMQALNEELTTVNAQLLAKMDELETTTNDLSSLLASTNLAIIILDRGFRIRRYTQAATDLFELIPTDVGRPMHDLRRKFTDPDLLADAQRVLDRLVPIERGVGSDSGRRYVRGVLPYRTADDRIDGVVITFVDVTAQRAADEALRASEARYRALAANLPNAAVFVVDPDLRYQLARGEGLAAAGSTPADFEGKMLSEALGRELAGRYEPLYRRALAGEPFKHEHAAHGRHFISHGQPMRDADGAVTAALAVSYDITDRVRAEAALRVEEERFRVLVENVRDHAIFALDPQGVVLTWNEAAERLLGYTLGEIVGHSGDVFFTPEDRQAGLPERERATAAATGKANDDNWAVRRDGRRFWASGSSSAVRDAAGALTGFVKVMRDRTEARVAEEAVRRAEEKLRLALAAARMGLWWWDVAADVQTRDENLNRMLGLPPATTRYPIAEFMEHIHPDDRAAVQAGFDASLREGGPLNTEFRVVRPDGSVRWLRDQGDVFGRPDDDSLHMSGACVDVTDRKEVEEELRLARDELEERVAERTGELAAAVEALEAEIERRRELARRLATAQEEERRRVARDLHDTLGQLQAGLGLAVAAAHRTPDLSAAASERLNDVERLADELARETHALAVRLRPTALDDLGLVPALRQLVDDWFACTGVGMEFDAAGVEGERLPAEVETAVYRVVQEALTNAAKHAGAKRVSVTVTRADGAVTAVVEDDGVGFNPAAAGAGRLGLVGMRERVELAGGTLEIESSPEAGTTVFARFPLRPVGPNP